MKKTVIILSVLALLVGGCKPKTTNIATVPQVDTLHILQVEPQGETDEEKKLRYQKEKQQLEDIFNSYPPVTAEEVAMIAPVIKKWTDFYKLDFAQARLMNINTTCFNCPQDECLWHYKIDKEEDTDKLIFADYSPNGKLYLIFMSAIEEDGKYYHIGFDDSQNVWLIDRKQKHATTILWHGVGGLTEGAFWKSNDVLIVVSCDYNEQPIIRYMVDVFDIVKQIQTSYHIMREEKNDFSEYYKIYLKEKGIIVK
jgi:hypothetical protein